MFPRKVVINLGFKCNFKCAHCANSFQKKKKLSPDEIGLLISTINKYGVQRVQFIGGEPFLYLKDINRIIKGIVDNKSLEVSVTTNGSFARSYDAAITALSAVPHIKRIQLSYDKFHARFLPFSQVENLVLAVRAMTLKFSVLCSIQAPTDMLTLAPLRGLGHDFPILVQKVLPQGRAVESGAVYSSYGGFDGKVLKRRCPDRNSLVYFCGKGFSSCCSTLMLGSAENGFHFETAEELYRSRFYRLTSRYTFGEIAGKLGVSRDSFKPEHSSVCNLCGDIFLSEKRGFCDGFKADQRIS